MGNIVFSQAAKFLQKRRNTRRWIAVVLCLALIVTSGTFGALTRHGSALTGAEQILDCVYEGHVHGEECYNEAGELVCGYADYCVHEHGENCHDSEGNLVCRLPEIEAHVHDESCYAEEEQLICGMEENEIHQHTDDCYDIELEALVCELEEHVHDDSCYELIPEGEEIPESEAAGNEENAQGGEAAGSEAPVQSEEPAGNEDASQSEELVGKEDVSQGEEPAGNEEAVQSTEPAESIAPQSEAPVENTEPDEGKINECAENRRLICEKEEHTHGKECYNQNVVLKCGIEEGSHTHNEKCYEAKQVAKCGKLELHTHSEECYTDGVLTCGKLELTEHVHGEECFREASVMELTATVGDVTITVSANEEGIIPAGAELSVTPVVKAEAETLDNLESEEEKAEAEALNAVYDEVQQGLEATVEDDETKEIKHFLAYDISFRAQNENGEAEEVKLNGEVNVTLEFPQGALPEEVISDENTQIESVGVLDMKETGEGLTAEMQDAVVNTTQDADVEKIETTLSDSTTIAIAWIGEINPETGEYVYEDDDVIITVSTLTEGAIPENAKLQVIPIIASEETGEQYQQVAEKLLEQAEGKEYEVAGFLAYDISFVDEEGNKIEPDGEVKVNMNYKEAKIPAEVDAATYAFAAEGEEAEGDAVPEPELNVTVMHLEEDGEGSVNVVDMAEKNRVTTLETTEEQKIQNAEFVTGGFSVFTITWTWDTSTPYVYEDDQVRITITAIDKDAIPQATSLSITPIRADDQKTAEQYREVARKLMEKAAGETYDIEGFLAYDISLIGEDGTEIEPDGKVKVTMEYRQPMAVVEIDPETYALVKQELADAAGNSQDAEIGTDAVADTPDGKLTEGDSDAVPENVPEVGDITVSDGNAESAAVSTEADSEMSGEEIVSGEAGAMTDSEELTSNGVIMAAEPAGPTVTIMHLEEDADGEVTQVVDLAEEDNVRTVEATEELEVQKVEFVTESFSTFTMTWTIPGGQFIKDIIFCDSNTGARITPANDISIQIPDGGSYDVSTGEYGGIKEGHDLYEITDQEGDKYVYKGVKRVIGEGNPSDAEVGEYVNAFASNGNGLICFLGNGSFSLDAGELNVHFYFMYQKEAKMEPVDTILDHEKDGIIMRIIDHNGYYNYDRSNTGDWVDGNAQPGGFGNGANGLMPSKNKNSDGSSVLGKVQQGLVKRTLNENGYPVYIIPTLDNGADTDSKTTYNDLDILFSDLNPNAQEVTGGLFLQDTYNETGYYEYSSFQNYAFLQDDGTFKVYRNLGTPLYSLYEGLNLSYQRGNFFPYNDINASNMSQITNQYDEDGNPLESVTEGNNTRKGESLHLVQDPNYFFGMYMEAHFTQPVGGVVEHDKVKNPMIYEFNGDDDLWIFIDGVLVLDIGGIHDACRGTINFQTGAVNVSGFSQTTIKAMYRAAGVLPDGTAWPKNEETEEGKNILKQYFDGETFVDYSSHNLKMFYMERGAGASDLHIKMNIPTIPQGTIEVEKQLTNTDKEKYKDVEFDFQVYVQKVAKTDEHGVETYETTEDGKAVYEPLIAGKNVNVMGGKIKAVDENGDQIAFTTDENGTFKLKQGESIRFSGLQSNRKYYVVETGVSSQEYDKVTIRSTTVESVNADGDVNQTYEAKSSEAEVGNRPHVTYLNNCSAANSRELRITKKMAGDVTTDEQFKFRITLGERTEEGNATATPILYDGPYYLQDENGNYLYLDEEGKVQKSTDAHVYGNAVNGEISGVSVGDTITITQIMSGTKFTVEEIEIDEEKYDAPQYKVDYVAMGQRGEGDGTEIPNGNKISGEIQLSKDAEVTVTNSYKSNYDWKLVKKSSTEGSDNQPILLSGAVFELVGVKEEDGVWKDITSEDARKYTGTSMVDDDKTSENETGIVTWIDEKSNSPITSIPQGTYKLAEKTSPAGYALNYAQWLLTIAADGKVDISLLGSNGKVIVDDNGKPMKVNGQEKVDSEGNKKVVFYFENEPVYALPSTGGEGIYWYSIGGTLLMMAGALILYRNKNKKVRGCRRA